MDMRILVGRNFARIRRDRGLTQEQLEGLTGHSQQYLSDLERGRRNPTVVTLFELAQALACTPADLVAADAEAVAARLEKAAPGAQHGVKARAKKAG